MDLHLKDKVVMVTGGGSGIDAAISLGLAREGAVPVILGKNPLDETFRATLAQIQPDFQFIQLELSDDRACRDAVAATADRFKRIDGL